MTVRTPSRAPGHSRENPNSKKFVHVREEPQEGDHRSAAVPVLTSTLASLLGLAVSTRSADFPGCSGSSLSTQREERRWTFLNHRANLSFASVGSLDH